MADPARYPDSDSGTDSGTGGDTGMGRGREPTTGTPRWVKVFGIVFVVVVLLLVVLMLTRGPGGHGPGRHTSSAGHGGQTSPVGVARGHAPPGGIVGGPGTAHG